MPISYENEESEESTESTETIDSEENVESAIICKHCGSDFFVRNGFDPCGHQKYRCRSCRRVFIEGDRRIKYSLLLRKLSVALYLLGKSTKGIRKALNASFGKKISLHAITGWLEDSSELLAQERKQREDERNGKIARDRSRRMATVEIDELYRSVKKNREIQEENSIAAEEYCLLLVRGEVRLLHLR
ncbi:MAG: hypothetical protein LBU15_03665 [Rickettsiales bacterium]|jgi:transposase-like protein|nr:hypothetical protein [Rickettsiales bacterium]